MTRSTDHSSLKNLTQKLEKKRPVEQSNSALPLEQIQSRPEDTRQLNIDHVKSLAESIAVLGLIEPLVTDIKGRLLAGGHRLAAINHLKETQQHTYPDKFPNNLVPVRVLSFDAEKEPELALQIEIAENEQRRDYTPSEVKAIAQRLKSAGYVEVKGRPREGEKPLMPALAVVLGKNLRTVRRYLNEDSEQRQREKSRTTALLLKQILPKLKKLQQVQPGTPKEEALVKKLPTVIRAIEDVLKEQETESQPEQT